MTERSGTAAISERAIATIRPYRPGDHGAGRRLWSELAQQHRELYGGGADAGDDRAGPGDRSAAAAMPDPAGAIGRTSSPPPGLAERPAIDPGAAFEEYLARLDLSGMWVADHPDDGVVGLVGLILAGRTGRVEPVVVTARRRGQGIGRSLLRHVAREARGRGMQSLTVVPESRNMAAIRCLHAAGYDALSAVELTVDLSQRDHDWHAGLEFQGLRFRH